MADNWKVLEASGAWVLRPDVASVRAEIHGQYDKWYGEEYDDLKRMLDDLVAAVRREAAAEIRKAPGWVNGEEWMDSRDRDHAADLIDPDKKVGA